MSIDAEQRLTRWCAWLPANASNLEHDEMFNRWQQGIEPPNRPYESDWMQWK